MTKLVVGFRNFANAPKDVLFHDIRHVSVAFYYCSIHGYEAPWSSRSYKLCWEKNIAYISNLSKADGTFLWKIFTHIPGCTVL